MVQGALEREEGRGPSEFMFGAVSGGERQLVAYIPIEIKRRLRFEVNCKWKLWDFSWKIVDHSF